MDACSAVQRRRDSMKGDVCGEQGAVDSGSGTSEDVQIERSSLLRCAQESRGDEDGDREQIVFGLAVAADDAAVYGGKSRAVCGVGVAPPSS
jgi:hypothetical protein